jgi:hypothetical protein
MLNRITCQAELSIFLKIFLLFTRKLFERVRNSYELNWRSLVNLLNRLHDLAMTYQDIPIPNTL